MSLFRKERPEGRSFLCLYFTLLKRGPVIAGSYGYNHISS